MGCQMSSKASNSVLIYFCLMSTLFNSCSGDGATASPQKIPSDSIHVALPSDTTPVVLPPNTLSFAGQNYRTVKIGKQTWMAENLNFKGVDGDTIGYCYNNSSDSCKKYGRHYTWANVMKLHDSCNTSNCDSQIEKMHRGICPNGWHIPTDGEWDLFEDFVGDSIPGKKLKSTSGWILDGNGTDEFGFSVFPTGILLSKSLSDKSGLVGAFWTSTPGSETFAYFRYFKYDYDGIVSYYNNITKSYLFSIRCVQN
jgi:uncharacterized protein (TIGR02145 family)